MVRFWATSFASWSWWRMEAFNRRRDQKASGVLHRLICLHFESSLLCVLVNQQKCSRIPLHFIPFDPLCYCAIFTMIRSCQTALSGIHIIKLHFCVPHGTLPSVRLTRMWFAWSMSSLQLGSLFWHLWEVSGGSGCFSKDKTHLRSFESRLHLTALHWFPTEIHSVKKKDLMLCWETGCAVYAPGFWDFQLWNSQPLLLLPSVKRMVKLLQELLKPRHPFHKLKSGQFTVSVCVEKKDNKSSGRQHTEGSTVGFFLRHSLSSSSRDCL